MLCTAQPMKNNEVFANLHNACSQQVQPATDFYMTQFDTAELVDAESQVDTRFGKNGKLRFSANSFQELLLDIKNIFSVDKSIREVACDLCKVVLTSLNERLDNIQIDICFILGRIEGHDLLKLKGAAGFQPNGMLDWKNIKFGEGIVGQAAQDKIPIAINDLRIDPHGASEFERNIGQLAEKVAILAYPLVLADGELVGILVLGKFHSGAVSEGHFWQPDFIKMIEWLLPHLATTVDNAIWLAKARRLKLYHENEQRMRAKAKKFYSVPVPDLNFLMEEICLDCMKILNSGKPEQPFYQNFLFYEYQEYRKLFVLRFCGRRPKSVLSSFHVKSRHYKEFVQDGQVKCLESQAKFVSNRGKAPYVIRYLFKNKLEEIIPKLDANSSPAGLGTAFIVPLFENVQPLGALVFWSRKQHRQYVNKPEFYLGPERRTVGANDLRFFRSLQPLIASEYQKLKADEYNRRRIIDLENLMGALKEVVLIEEKGQVLDRLAEFTAKSLNADGCFIHLLDPSKSQLTLQAVAGFHSDSDLKKVGIYSLKRPEGQHKPLPVQIFENQKEVIANSGRKFRRLTGNRNPISPYFRQLKSKKVISYLGRPIGNLGVIEVFNKSKITPSGWSFFEEQDATTLRHICDVIATVLKRMDATASHVQNEKVKVTSELLLDISHELKNPLYSSLIFLRKLKSSLNGHLTSEDGNLQTIDIIERNVEKAQRILRGMQNFQDSMRQINPERVNLEIILRMVIETNKSFCEQQRITIGSEFSAAEPLVYGDELQLNQLFTNLVKNAIDAMTNGGMLLVRLFEMDGSLQVETADTGSGIPDDIKDRLFEPFVTTKTPESGTGLGLALCKRIISQHHGTIEFETKLGWGTRFLVTLPRLVEKTFSPVKQLVSQPSPDCT